MILSREASAAPKLGTAESVPPGREAILEQLHKITNSIYFRNSKRYPIFIQYVVEHELERPGEVLKERTIGVKVFHRPNDYDTAIDPIVRVTAGEIRKRLAQYYQEPRHRDELRIELPLGSYVPFFLDAAAKPGVGELTEPAHEHHVETREQSTEKTTLLPSPIPISQSDSAERVSRVKGRIYLLVALGSAALFVFTFLIPRIHSARNRDRGIEYCWGPVLKTDNPVLIVIGTHSLDRNGRDLSPGELPDSDPAGTMLSSMTSSDMVPVSDLVSFSNFVRLLAHHDHKYVTQAAQQTTFEQIQQGPILLIGGFDNPWTLRLTSKLPYIFQTGSKGVNWIVDQHQPQNHQNRWSFDWSFDNTQEVKGNSRDYAIVAGFFDPDIQQHILIAAGIGKAGTAAAAEFLTTSSYLESWMSANPTGKSNFEAVLTTEIVDGQQGPPQVLRSRTW